ncbi:hypothetical protein COLO4_12303 [Corchorus olitorius]|uniref:Uncharacterized protein n=1 Tax=Corchorus olitorius TaxID=93759 RepID=A0A1R3K1B9_9ROSI|nr:hypothetical protein COLO4_12303 [Corchorus olitorius]
MSCTASKIYVNLDIPEVGLVQMMYQELQGPVEVGLGPPDYLPQ